MPYRDLAPRWVAVGTESVGSIGQERRPDDLAVSRRGNWLVVECVRFDLMAFHLELQMGIGLIRLLKLKVAVKLALDDYGDTRCI